MEGLIPAKEAPPELLARFGYRRESQLKPLGEIMMDSEKVVCRAIAAGIKIKAILATQKHFQRHWPLIQTLENTTLILADRDFMRSIVGHRIHQGMMALAPRPADADLLELGERVLVFNGLTDATNIGTSIRSGMAFGFDSFLIDQESCSPFTRRSIRVSMGSVFGARVHHCEDLVKALGILSRRSYTVVGSGLWGDAAAVGNLNITGPLALVVGNEDAGVSPSVKSLCHNVAKIPISAAVDSLNAAAATSVMMYHFSRGI